MTYNKIVLNDSILDIDSWLPEGTIDSIVKIIIHANTPLNKNPKMFTEH